MKRLAAAFNRLEKLLTEEDPLEPKYDPSHLAAVLIGTMAAIGAVYWLLWTLLVYEGGIVMKASSVAGVIFTSRTWAELAAAIRPDGAGELEGWLANVLALALTLTALFAVRRKLRGAGAP